ncbi:MAG: MBL fold metallo-hydrolase [Gemmatimonadales bacterium]|nr:MAG: MBL fold metallo-hydrolase [Gemmatimonadales bacterium]
MTLSRRDFASFMAAALAGAAVPGALAAAFRPSLPAPLEGAVRASARSAQETYFQWSEVRPGVRVASGGGGNTILYLGRTGALQSDGKNFGLGRTLRREAESFGVPVTQLVNTHHHGDHSGGNEGFSDLPRLAHVNALPRIRASVEASLEGARDRLGGMLEQMEAGDPAQADVEAMLTELDGITPEDFTPDRTFEGEAELSVDGRPVECRWVSRGHTDGDNFLYLPQANVLHCGDLFFHGRHPYVDDTAGATPAGWIRCVDAMLDLCDGDTVVVPGHGEVTDRAGLVGQKAYFQALQGMVEQALAEGRSKDEVMALEAPELVALAGSDRHLPRNLGIVYDEMMG